MRQPGLQEREPPLVCGGARLSPDWGHALRCGKTPRADIGAWPLNRGELSRIFSCMLPTGYRSHKIVPARICPTLPGPRLGGYTHVQRRDWTATSSSLAQPLTSSGRDSRRIDLARPDHQDVRDHLPHRFPTSTSSRSARLIRSVGGIAGVLMMTDPSAAPWQRTHFNDRGSSLTRMVRAPQVWSGSRQ